MRQITETVKTKIALLYLTPKQFGGLSKRRQTKQWPLASKRNPKGLDHFQADEVTTVNGIMDPAYAEAIYLPIAAFAD